MKLDLKQIFDIPGEVKQFHYILPLADYELYGVHPFFLPVTAEGCVENETGVVYLRYSVSFSLRLPCDRCMEEFDRNYRYAFEEILVPEESVTHDEYIAVPGGLLDLDEAVLSDILLSLPSKQLCREDCQGICPVCGANRNQTPCGHSPVS